MLKCVLRALESGRTILAQKLGRLIGMHIEASDGEIGEIKDVYFDDHCWAVRYLVVATGAWFAQHKVLISPISVAKIDWDNGQMEVSLSRQEVRTSPPIDTDKPVSRQHEVDYFDHYGYPYYWNGPSLWGDTAGPLRLIGPIPPARNIPDIDGEAPLDPRLRSAVEVTGYVLRTTDTAMGHVEDFLLDFETWAIRYLVVNTRHWLTGKHILVPPQWIADVDWPQRVVSINVASDIVRAAPPFDPHCEFSDAHETNLYRHYQRHEVPLPAREQGLVPAGTPIDPVRRDEMIRVAAYFRSQQRALHLTHEAEDWLAAERQIDRMLMGHT